MDPGDGFLGHVYKKVIGAFSAPGTPVGCTVLTDLKGKHVVWYGKMAYREATAPFLNDFMNLIWVCCSDSFKQLIPEKSNFEGTRVRNEISDTAWGSTLRAMQMLVANCVHLKLYNNVTHDVIEGLFDDNRRYSPDCAFSIHNIAKEGLEKFKVYPGTEYSIP